MKALLFDMDGVLVDVSQSYRLAIQKTAEYFLNQPVDLALIQDYKKKGGLNNDWDLTEAILKDAGMDLDKDQIIHQFQMFYLGNNFDGLINNETWLLNKDILRTISQQCSTGIVTGRPRMETDYVLKHYDVSPFFRTSITMDDIPRDKGKPHPMGIQRALQILEASEAFYFGDTGDDMRAAVAAGIVPVGVFNGIGSKEEQKKHLMEAGAHMVLESINQIEEVLNEPGSEY